MGAEIENEGLLAVPHDHQHEAAASSSQSVYLSGLDIEKGDEILQQEDIGASYRLYSIGQRCFTVPGIPRPKILLFLAPSFLTSSAKNPNLHPTSWLDGLRGVAAFIVFLSHFILGWFPGTFAGFYSTPNAHNFFQLPFIRILYAGRGVSRFMDYPPSSPTY